MLLQYLETVRGSLKISTALDYLSSVLHCKIFVIGSSSTRAGNKKLQRISTQIASLFLYRKMEVRFILMQISCNFQQNRPIQRDNANRRIPVSHTYPSEDLNLGPL
jgi:hypothetical protein